MKSTAVAVSGPRPDPLHLLWPRRRQKKASREQHQLIEKQRVATAELTVELSAAGDERSTLCADGQVEVAGVSRGEGSVNTCGSQSKRIRKNPNARSADQVTDATLLTSPADPQSRPTQLVPELGSKV
jgi:hypothetical protein